MAILGISIATLFSIFFWGWISGILTVFAFFAFSSKLFKSKKKV